MKILIIGDSHSQYFNITPEIKSLDKNFHDIDTRVLSIPGATIQGFGKRESSLNTTQEFIKTYNSFNPDYVCFSLGQVDIELGYYFKKIIKGEDISISDFIDETTSKYISTIKKLESKLSLNEERIIIKGINLSVLTKERKKSLRYTNKIITENINNPLDKKIAFQKLKTDFPLVLDLYKNHTNFNSQLKKKTKGTYKYFDINDEIIDENNLFEVNPMYIPSKFDHHLVDSLYMRKIHLMKLLNVIYT